MNGNIVVGQSGGPTAVINSSVAGVYAAAKELGINKIYGMVHGIEGFLKEALVDLRKYLDTDENLALLKGTPSAFLGSCRFKMPKPEGNESVYEKVFEIMEKYDIEYFLYIGGNDSMDTVKMLSDYAREHGKKQCFMGIPKTIDNDLPITDHCPGYGSVAKYIATSVKEIIRDNESFGTKSPTITIVETMGRNAGWITAAATLAKGADCSGVDAIYIPERVFDVDAFLKKVSELASIKTSVVIAITEGVKLSDGRYASELASDNDLVDSFGHKQTTGVATYLANLISANLKLKTKAVELSAAQRAATHLASLTDINEAYSLGYTAAMAACQGKTGMMPVLIRKPSKDYQCEISLYDIHEIANVEKLIPDEWITEDGCHLTDDYEKYARPLIMGEYPSEYENGLPKHLVLEELLVWSE